MAVSERPDPAESKLAPVVACTLTNEDLGTQAERWTRLRSEAGLDRVETENGLSPVAVADLAAGARRQGGTRARGKGLQADEDAARVAG